MKIIDYLCTVIITPCKKEKIAVMKTLIKGVSKRQYVTAPKVHSNPVFNRMVCPIEVLPPTIWVRYRNHNNIECDIELPTAECFAEGNWVARRYAGFPTHLIERALNSRKIFCNSIICAPDNWIEIL